MPRDKGLKRVLVIGSGPIIIGQAAEFDYAGTQACISLREEGLEVVLVNSNPATIMTDVHMAERVYMEPLTADFVAQVIRREHPDGLLPTLGGQVGLNLAMELAETGVLEEESVRLLGTPLEAIRRAEDRELFKDMMQKIGEPVPESAIVASIDEAMAFSDSVGFPLIIRPAYTLGGTGGGLAGNVDELRAVATRGLKISPIHQVLVERSVAGWKEIEYEVMRDAADNCITICNMENIDPVGIHTGDSIVVAPSQTLADREYQMLRRASLKIIRALGIQGGCNIQFALDPGSLKYFVIEVNPRVSRSSALASKATGYPIAKVAAKVAVGLTLDEIVNTVTGKTRACFEPALDYVVIKVPRFPFDKFALAERTLGTQMKATGEVMAIGRSFESALLKATRSLELGVRGLSIKGLEAMDNIELETGFMAADDRRLFLLAEALRRGRPVAELAGLTGMDRFFLDKVRCLVELEREMSSAGSGLDEDLLKRAKVAGYADLQIAEFCGLTEEDIRNLRKTYGLTVAYKMVDTCAAEFEATTPYFYSAYGEADEVEITTRPKVLVLGSGPIRIGQGIEFDYCSVRCVWALRDEGIETVIINNNPETVSTDFDTADRLYFEPLVTEDVLAVIDKEKPMGVVVQFGGQTAINLAESLARAGVHILGTKVEDIDRAEDRDRFDTLLVDLGIPKPPGHSATSLEQAAAIAGEIGFPVLVRPSYVLGGRAMEVVYNQQDLVAYMNSAVEVSPRHPVLVDKYFSGVEVEVDAVADGEDVLIPGIMQHVERAGVHSGDSIAVYPAYCLSPRAEKQIIEYTERLALALKIKGILNIQYVVHDGEVYVLEVNPRSSRTVPFLSKVTGISMIKLATKVMLGHSLRSQGYTSGLCSSPGYVAVKVPVFSFGKLTMVDTSLGPEMKSTGEVIGIDNNLDGALFKGLLAAGLEVPLKGTILATIADKDKEEALPLLERLAALGYHICATRGTAQALQQVGLEVEMVNKIYEAPPHIVDHISSGRIHFVINTLTRGRQPERDGFQIRRAAVEHGIPCLTSLDTASALVRVLEGLNAGETLSLRSLQEYLEEAQEAVKCPA